MSRSHIFLILILLIVIGCVAFFAYRSYVDSTGKTVSVAESLQREGMVTLTDLLGNAVDLHQYDGKILVINTWASWCPFCVEELPHFDQIAKEYADKNVVILAINRAESPLTAKAYIEHVGSPKNIIFLLDEQDSFYKQLGGFSMPETVFYAEDGTLVSHVRGALSLENIRNNVEATISYTPNN